MWPKSDPWIRFLPKCKTGLCENIKNILLHASVAVLIEIQNFIGLNNN